MLSSTDGRHDKQGRSFRQTNASSWRGIGFLRQLVSQSEIKFNKNLEAGT